MNKFPLVTIEFDDHVTCTGMSQASLQRCTVVGWLIKETKESYTVCTWVSGTIKDDGSDFAVIRKHKGLVLTKIRQEK